MKSRRTAIAGACVVFASLTACGGTSSASDVCDKYDKVAEEIANDKVAGAFNGEIFDALDNLAKKVKKFDDEPDLKATGEAMLDMANDDSASIDEVNAMIAPVKDFCESQ